jgi:MFS family permease
MRAVVADMVPSGRQGTAFGCYNAAFGASWFLGSTAVGMFYGTSWTAMVLLSMGLQFAAAPLFVAVMRMEPWKNSGPVRGRARAPSSALPRPGQLRTGDLVFVYEARPTTVGSEAVTLGSHSIPVTPDTMVHGVTNMTIDSTR